MQRVDILLPTNTSKLIVVAPHGPDDHGTAQMAKSLHVATDCFCVINNSFKKTTSLNSVIDLADCNDLTHCRNDSAVKSEFYKPIHAIVQGLIAQNIVPIVLTIHGCEKSVPSDTFFVAGYGENGQDESRLTISNSQFNKFISQVKDELKSSPLANLNPYGAKFGSPYNAHSLRNLLQSFRQNYGNDKVEAIQLEFPPLLRQLPQAVEASKVIANALRKY